MGSQMSPTGPSVDGLATVRGAGTVAKTMERLEAVVKGHGLRVFARIDFAGDAASEGLAMRPMAQLVFGNPKAGTPLLVAAPTLGIDLPLKVLVWEDGAGAVWLSYNDPERLIVRHGVPRDLLGNIVGIRALVEAAAQPAG
jgi:uncharacterized protein (DUF302 family)